VRKVMAKKIKRNIRIIAAYKNTKKVGTGHKVKQSSGRPTC
jgi:hypothetical protein